MKIRNSGWAIRLALLSGLFFALPAWACIDASGMTLTLGTPGLGLSLTATVNQAQARPGDTLRYTLDFCNAGNSAISDLTIENPTPAATWFLSASCGALPQDMRCSVSMQPAQGASGTIVWKLNGVLASGASGVVNFEVRLP